MKRQLTSLIQKYDLINRAYDLFWANYDSYLKEEPGEADDLGLIDRSSIESPLLRYADYTLMNYDGQNGFGLELLSIRLDFCRKGEKSPCIGDFLCEFTMDGDLYDDYFVTY